MSNNKENPSVFAKHTGAIVVMVVLIIISLWISASAGGNIGVFVVLFIVFIGGLYLYFAQKEDKRNEGKVIMT